MSRESSARCMVCQSTRLSRINGPRRPWDYVRCGDCAHVMLVPQPTSSELARFYNTTYRVALPPYLASARREMPHLRRLLGPTPGRLLELGCSYGAMLAAFRDDGWTVEGVELDARACEHAKTTFGLRVHQGTIEESLGNVSMTPDVVAAYHVIEHVPEPRMLLRQIARMLPRDGRLLLRTPNASSLSARVSGGWWEWLSAPEHLHVFSPTSIARLLTDEGFEVRTLETRRGDAAGLLFESIRAGAKRLLARGGPSFAGAPSQEAGDPLRSRGWYRGTQAVVDVVGAPADWTISLLDRMGIRWGPELLVLAVRT
jgi:SAM-dependent methyltransferase